MTKEQYLLDKLGTKLRPGYSAMFRAKCFRCNGNYVGGVKREDCGIETCEIYYWMPYRKGLPILDWMFDLDYTDKHRVTATVEGYIIKGQTQTIIDRHRYWNEKLIWTGEPLVKPKVKRVRRIA
jgi:hypothetical protein